MRPRRIMIASSVHYWSDPRILYKEARSLARHFEVELHIQYPRKTGTVAGVNIRGLPPSRTLGARIRRVGILIYRFMVSRVNVVLIHDPELVLPLWVGRWFRNYRIIYDMHEDFPLVARSRRWIPGIFRAPVVWFASFVENFALRCYDGILFASPGLGDKTTRRPSLVVPNYPLLDSYTAEKYAELSLVYIGDITLNRGVMNLLALSQALQQTGIPYRLDLYGNIPHSEIKQMVMNAGGESNHTGLHWRGRLPHDHMMQVVKKYHFGLIPLEPDPRFYVGLPTKLFEYMYAELVSITIPIPGWEKIVNEHQCGLATAFEDAPALAGRIVELFSSGAWETMGRNGRRAVLENYCWEMEQEKLIAFFQTISNVRDVHLNA